MLTQSLNQVVCVWVLTGHWALMDFMGMGLCVAFIAFVRLPSLKVSTLLLSGLLLYDVFWVFFSQVSREGGGGKGSNNWTLT